MRRTRLAPALTLTLALALGACASLLTGGPLVRDPNGPTGQLVVRNGSKIPLNVVLISACSASTYGLNRLPRDTQIEPGASYAFTVSPGCWDVGGGSTAESRDGFQRLEVAAGGTTRLTLQ